MATGRVTDHTGPNGHVMNVITDTLADGTLFVTVQAYLGNDGSHATPQAMYAAAKRVLNHPKRYAKGASEHMDTSCYTEGLK